MSTPSQTHDREMANARRRQNYMKNKRRKIEHEKHLLNESACKLDFEKEWNRRTKNRKKNQRHRKQQAAAHTKEL